MRVTFVNFTTTQSSLQNQCMNFLLKSERPDVDEKRKNMIKLQSELKVVFSDQAANSKRVKPIRNSVNLITIVSSKSLKP